MNELLSEPDPFEHYACSIKINSTGFTKLMKWVLLTNAHPELLPHILELISTDKSHINKQNTAGWNSLMLACRNPTLSSEQTIQILIDNGANINMQNNTGSTALMMSTVYSSSSIVKLLIDHGADPNLQNARGYTALMLACMYSGKFSLDPVIRILIEANSCLSLKNIIGETAMMIATKYNRPCDYSRALFGYNRPSSSKTYIEILKEADLITVEEPLISSSNAKNKSLDLATEYTNDLDIYNRMIDSDTLSIKSELEKYPLGIIISYINNKNIFRPGGIILKYNPDYFIYMEAGLQTKYRARYSHINKIWIGFDTDKHFISNMEVISQCIVVHRPDTSIDIHRSPSSESKIIAQAYYGDIFDICGIRDEWVEIIHGYKFGWIQITNGTKEIIKKIESIKINSPVPPPIPSTHSSECCVCFDLIIKKITLIPCGHTKICEKCVDFLYEKKCPICMIKFQSYIRIYE